MWRKGDSSTPPATPRRVARLEFLAFGSQPCWERLLTGKLRQEKEHGDDTGDAIEASDRLRRVWPDAGRAPGARLSPWRGGSGGGSGEGRRCPVRTARRSPSSGAARHLLPASWGEGITSPARPVERRASLDALGRGEGRHFSGARMNSSRSSGGRSKRPRPHSALRHSALAASIRSSLEATKFHQM